MNIEILIVLFFIYGLTQFILGFYISKKRAKLKGYIRDEKTRTHFAEVRNDLMKMVRENEIDVNGPIFKDIYLTTSFIMRRPDQYKDISNAITITLFKSVKEIKFQEKELAFIQNNNDIKNILKRYSEGCSLLILNYSFIRRMITQAEYRTGFITWVLKKMLFILKFLAEKEEKKKPEIITIGKVQKRLQSIYGGV